MDTRVPPTSSFWSKNGRKALKRKGWKAPNQLVRMRSAVRIRPAAPEETLKPQWFEVFFFFVSVKAGIKTQTKTQTRFRFAGRVIPVRLFYCIPEDLAGSFHAFLIGVGIHSQRYRFVAVAQLFRYAGYICTVCNGNTGKGMPQIVEADVRESGVLQDFYGDLPRSPDGIFLQ